MAHLSPSSNNKPVQYWTRLNIKLWPSPSFHDNSNSEAPVCSAHYHHLWSTLHEPVHHFLMSCASAMRANNPMWEWMSLPARARKNIFYFFRFCMCGMKINLLVSTLPNYGQSPLGPKYLYSIILEAAYYYVSIPSTTTTNNNNNDNKIKLDSFSILCI